MFMFLQGIPLGLTAAIPYILLSSSDGINYGFQAAFSFALWPFSLKLAWAPLVDSIYSSRFGRRKSWLIPVQYTLGINLLILSHYVNDWFGKMPDNPWSEIASSHPVKINYITVAFFGLTLLASTQDIAVDGWALTMLSKLGDKLLGFIFEISCTLIFKDIFLIVYFMICSYQDFYLN